MRLVLLGVLASIGLCAAVNPNSPYYSTRVGDFTVTVISDGTSDQISLEQIAFAAPAPAISILKEQHGIGNSFTMHYNPLHVDTGLHKVIIDTGSSNKFGGGSGKLLENMDKAGLDPMDVDIVLLTHAHVDHIAGVMKPDGSKAFPNARYYIGRIECEYWKWLSAEDASLEVYNVSDVLKQSIVDAAKTSLGFIEGNLVQFEFGDELVPGITSKELVGHTPGHSGFILRSQNESAVILGDSIVISFMQVKQPEWHLMFDMDPMQGVLTRYSILDEFADTGTRVFLYHGNFPGIGRILKENGGYGFQKAEYEL